MAFSRDLQNSSETNIIPRKLHLTEKDNKKQESLRRKGEKKKKKMGEKPSGNYGNKYSRKNAPDNLRSTHAAPYVYRANLVVVVATCTWLRRFRTDFSNSYVCSHLKSGGMYVSFCLSCGCCAGGPCCHGGP